MGEKSKAKMCPKIEDGELRIQFHVTFEDDVAPDTREDATPPDFTVEYRRHGETIKEKDLKTDYFPPGSPGGEGWFVCTKKQQRFQGKIFLKAKWKALTSNKNHTMIHEFEAGSKVNKKRLSIYLLGPELTILCVSKYKFGDGAYHFWNKKKKNQDVVVSLKNPSLEDVLKCIDSECKKKEDKGNYEFWGRINIVVHGRERLISMRLFPKPKTGPSGPSPRSATPPRGARLARALFHGPRRPGRRSWRSPLRARGGCGKNVRASAGLRFAWHRFDHACPSGLFYTTRSLDVMRAINSSAIHLRAEGPSGVISRVWPEAKPRYRLNH